MKTARLLPVKSARSRRKYASLALVAVLGLVTLAALTVLPSAPALAASEAETILQCNDIDVDNVAARSIDCEATVFNSVNLVTGTSSATVVTRTCIGLVADEAGVECDTNRTEYANAILSIIQCDSAGGGGNGQVTCSATVTNEITGTFSLLPATVNQCNGLDPDASPDIVHCDPPGIPGAANVSQCNYSGVGGDGPALMRCTMVPSTSAAEVPVTIDQCQSSGNGGGGTVICTASIRNVASPAQGAAGGGAGGGAGGESSNGAPGVETLPGTGTDSTLLQIGGLSTLLAGALLMTVARRETRTRSGARAVDERVGL